MNLSSTLDDVEPPVMRRVAVPFRIRFDRLHEVLQAAFGWTNNHLYEFRIRDVGFGIPDGGLDELIDAHKGTLLSAVEDIGARSFKYLHDFGDGWTHAVKIEKTFPVIADLDDPVLRDVLWRCPLEDVSGPSGCEEFREAPSDKNTNATINSSNGGVARTTIRRKLMLLNFVIPLRLWPQNGNADHARKLNPAALGECIRCEA
jgi:hypothetical protein